MIRSKEDKIFETVAYIVMFLVLIIVLFPFLLLFISSITEESSLLIHGYSIFPKKISFDAYSYIWESKDVIFKAYATTIGVTVIGNRYSLKRYDHGAGSISAFFGKAAWKTDFYLFCRFYNAF